MNNPFEFSDQNLVSAQEQIRTATPCSATPSRWCVYQFRHLGLFACKHRLFAEQCQAIIS